MTLDKARKPLQVQAGFGGFYNGNAAKLILSAVFKEHGHGGHASTPDTALDCVFGFESGTRFEGGLVLKK